MAITKALFAGDDATPDSVKRRLALAELLRSEGNEFAHVDSPLEAIGSVLKSAGGFMQERRAMADQKAGIGRRNAAQQSIANMLLGGGGGASAPASMTGPISGGMSSGGMGASAMASASPSPASPAGGARAAAGGPSAPSSALPQSFLASVDRTEGGGDYDTLFGHAQRGGQFGNVRISGMTVGQAIDFASPNGAYGQYVKGKVGKVATPMGRHQIVGTTLRNAANEMGLDPSTPFNQQTQDAIAAHLARKRVASSNSMPGKIAALRSEWEGFRHVPDAQMATIVADLEGGGSMPAAATAPQRPVQVASNDPTIGVAAATAPSAGSATPTPQPAANNQQVAQLLTQGAPLAPPSMTNGVSQEQIAQLLSDPYTEDLGQQLLQQMLGDRQKQAEAQAAWQRDVYKTQEERAYDASVRQEGYQREDSRNAITDARQANRDQRTDSQNDRDFAFRVEQGNKPPTSVQEYEYARSQGYTGTYADYEQANRKAGATNVTLPGQPNIGTIPPGYQAIRDEVSGGWTMAPIPGGPAAAEAAKVQRAADSKKDSTQRYGGVVIEDIDRAIGIIEKGGFRLPVTGGGATIASNLGGTEANDLRALLDTVKSNSTFDRLQAMRDASPTGAALGAVSDTELGLLQAAIGSLDQSQSERQILKNLRRVREITDEIVNGDTPTPTVEQPAASPNMKPVTAGFGAGAQSDASKPPEGVDPADWEMLTPEERRLWQ